MRILHAYKIYRPDIEAGVPNVISALTTMPGTEIETRVLVARRRGWRRNYNVNGIPVQATTSLGGLFSMPIAPDFPFVLARAARSADILAIHSPFPLNDVGVMLGLPERLTLIVHWHSEIFGRRAFVPFIAPLVHRSLARADRIIVSHPSLIAHSQFLAGYADKIVVIPLGTDVRYWGAIDEQQRDAAKRLRTAYPRLVVALGRLVPYKGFDILVRAMRDLDATVALIGAGPMMGPLQRLAAQFGVADRLIFTGRIPRDEIKVYFHAARAFAFPSVTPAETFGIAQIEAMAAGLPIVNTRLPTAVPEVARHECEALTVPPGNVSAFAAALGRILDDSEIARQFGKSGKERAAAEYEQSKFVTRTHAVYSAASRERLARFGEMLPKYRTTLHCGE
jgi:rhamnosyl/mannosyltransferase